MENKTDNRFNPIRDVPRLQELAAKNIFLGTSSWKYEGSFFERMFEVYPISFDPEERILLANVLNKSFLSQTE